jgi:hypothetical protein
MKKKIVLSMAVLGLLSYSGRTVGMEVGDSLKLMENGQDACNSIEQIRELLEKDARDNGTSLVEEWNKKAIDILSQYKDLISLLQQLECGRWTDENLLAQLPSHKSQLNELIQRMGSAVGAVSRRLPDRQVALAVGGGEDICELCAIVR